MRKAIYTVITGKYDTLKTPKVISEGWDYICFTDDIDLTSDFWQIRYLGEQTIKDPQLLQRHIKILAHIWLPEYARTVYIDGSTVLIGDINLLVDKYHEDRPLLTLKMHPHRKCVYDEIKACIIRRKDNKDRLIKYQYRLYNNRVPSNIGLYETGILIRDNCPGTNAICEKWFKAVADHSIRDQISLPVIMRAENFAPNVYPYGESLSYIRVLPHLQLGVTRPRVWFLQPFAVDQNIGREYNVHCEQIPEKDWVCITDMDSMFLHPHNGKQIHDIVATTGKEFDLLGCITNRLGSTFQCYGNERSDDPDILNHYKIAEELYNTKYDRVRPILRHIAGLLMLMPKATWNKIKFREKDIGFDTTFCKHLMQIGGNIGIMEGVYRFHYYRFHHTDPRAYKEHLKSFDNGKTDN